MSNENQETITIQLTQRQAEILLSLLRSRDFSSIYKEMILQLEEGLKKS